jgi:hypothetical protein
MKILEILKEEHDAVMYKQPHMTGMDKKRILFNYPGTLGRNLVAFKKVDGEWIPRNSDAEPYLDLFHKHLGKLDEVQFGGQDVEGNPLSQLKEKFPNLSTLLYFIPGLGQALMVADVASQLQMYNQAIDKIEKQYPTQTIQAVQQKVGDAGEEWETL